MNYKSNKLSALAAAMMLASSGVSAELIFSEYLEGASYNKALELYNSGTETIDLAQYKLVKFTNGVKSKSAELMLSGRLAAGETYVIANTRIEEELKRIDLKDGKVTNFNGNDPLQIKRASDGRVIDMLGNFGGINFGKDTVLSRKPDQLKGSGEKYNSAQWDVKNKNDTAGFGDKPTKGPGPTPKPHFLECDDENIPRISTVQGSGLESPLKGKIAQVKGIITRKKGDQYYLQQQPSAADQQGSSLAIRVYHADNTYEVGDNVTIQGTVEERYKVTQITSVLKGDKCGTGQIDPINLEMPEDGNFEPYESMLTNLKPRAGDEGFYISELYGLNRYGDTVISSGSNLYKPTNKYLAGSAEAKLQQQKNDANRLTLDDGISKSNPGDISYLPELSFDKPVRVGDRITSGLTGVITEGFGVYRLIPDGAVTVDSSANPRVNNPKSPKAGDLRIASFNVLNYFNGKMGADGEISWKQSDNGKARGANNENEFKRQRSKIISALARMEADVFGILEMENDGWGEDSAIADLVKGVNESGEKPAAKKYDFVRTADKYIGKDVIKVSLIFDKTTVKPVGEPIILTSYPFDEKTSKHRPPMIQTFKELKSGKEVTVVVNHFKSKGSACKALADPEDKFGQGNCNRQRVAAAETLGKYLEKNFAGDDVLIIGDLNAYAKEDPVLVLTGDDTGRQIEKSLRSEDNKYSAVTTDYHLGYKNLLGENPLSYVFKGEAGALDHALGSPTLAKKVTEVFEWSVNAFELKGQDYNEEFKKATDSSGRTWEERLVRANEPFRSSDHDPVMVDLKLADAPEEEEERRGRSCRKLWLNDDLS